jgi:hypothetical protein
MKISQLATILVFRFILLKKEALRQINLLGYFLQELGELQRQEDAFCLLVQ